MANRVSYMNVFLGVALAVKRIKTGVPQKIDPSNATDTAALMRDLLTGDPALAQECLRLVCGVGKDTLNGIIEAVTHEADEGCEDCSEKLNSMAEPLRNIISADHAETLISTTEKAMAQVLADHGGDVKAAVRAAAQEAGLVQEYTEADTDSVEPTVFGGGQKKKVYLN